MLYEVDSRCSVDDEEGKGNILYGGVLDSFIKEDGV